MSGRRAGEAPRVRSFVSIQLPRAARDAIRPTLDALAAQDIRGLRPVPARSAHVTVRFLGDVDSGDLGAVRAALAEAALSARPFRLGLGDVGCFPASGPPSVLWVGIEGDLAGADRLRAAVDGALGPLAPGDGGRGLVPHVTLARLGRRTAGPDRRRALEAARSRAPTRVGFDVRAVSLMRSRLSARGAEHTTLGEFALGRRGGDA